MNQTQPDCIFCKIVSQEIPAPILYQNDGAIVFADRAPRAAHHYLIVPKAHREDMRSIAPDDSLLTSGMFDAVRYISREIAADLDFNIQVNNGKNAGQEVFHLHWHYLAGKRS